MILNEELVHLRSLPIRVSVREVLVQLFAVCQGEATPVGRPAEAEVPPKQPGAGEAQDNATVKSGGARPIGRAKKVEKASGTPRCLAWSSTAWHLEYMFLLHWQSRRVTAMTSLI